MTVVEFFANSPIENMVSCFSLNPHKVIFIGNGRRAKKHVAAYERLAARMGLSSVFELRSVANPDINAMVDCLCSIVATEKQCFFDLTGGDDSALVAMGIAYERMKHNYRHLQMQRFNLNSGRFYDCDGDGEFFSPKETFLLSVKENIELHGGSVSGGIVYKDLESPGDVELLWELCRKNPTSWNRSVGRLSELLRNCPTDNNGLTACFNVKNLAEHYHGSVNRIRQVRDFAEALHRMGLVAYQSNSDSEFVITFKNRMVKKCLLKSGNALEYKMLSLASQIKDNKGTFVFNDCMCGVVIDWDGITKKEGRGFEGSINEIDLLLMKKLTPIFVSCKNGGVEESELYKLSAVAERFGGKYAKKILVASGINKTGQGLDYFLARATDLGVTVIDKVHRMPDDKLVKKICSI